MMQHHHHSVALSENSGNKDVVVKRRTSEEQGPMGKFKFKDSIRERFSHEFEAKAENATVTSDHFTGSHLANSSKVSSSHQEFYAKRRRPSRSCDESGSEVNSSTSQVYFFYNSLVLCLCDKVLSILD